VARIRSRQRPLSPCPCRAGAIDTEIAVTAVGSSAAAVPRSRTSSQRVEVDADPNRVHLGDDLIGVLVHEECWRPPKRSYRRCQSAATGPRT
jgi:hypothetical protein